MDQRHKKIIRENLDELADVTNDINTIIENFASAGLLNVYMVNHLHVSILELHIFIFTS